VTDNQEHSPAPDTIREALVYIKIQPPVDAVARKVELGKALPTYPEVRERRRFQSELKVDSAEVKTQVGTEGLWFYSADGRCITQFGNSGWAYNQLAPYQKWAAFLPDAKRTWLTYETILAPVAAKRIGLRYINNLRRPNAGFEFEHVLRCPPVVPEKLPQTVADFLTRMVVPYDKEDRWVTITQQLEHVQSARGEVSIVVDIDAYRIYPDSTPLADLDFDRELGHLRRIKNETYRALLTEDGMKP